MTGGRRVTAFLSHPDRILVVMNALPVSTTMLSKQFALPRIYRGPERTTAGSTGR